MGHFFCVFESSIATSHGPSSGMELRPSSASQSVGLGVWHDHGGWPGRLGARVELGDFGADRSTLHRAPVGQGPPGPDWLAIAFVFWSGRPLATGTAWAAGFV